MIEPAHQSEIITVSAFLYLWQRLPITNDVTCTDYGRDCLIIGDFNFGDDDADASIRRDFIDAWRYLHPEDPGYLLLSFTLHYTHSTHQVQLVDYVYAQCRYTFDPLKNSLAALNSKSGKPKRLDRILIRSNGQWVPHSVELFGILPTSFHLTCSLM